MILYTAGYNNWVDDDFFKTLRELNEDYVVIDVRFSPFSKMPWWTKKALSNELGESYIHMGKLGNINYNSVNSLIKIADIETCEKVIQIMNKGFVCILLCACDEYDKCHRKIVAEEIQKRTDCKIRQLEELHED
jgi:uncharacterized protein (DUF488 family)